LPRASLWVRKVGLTRRVCNESPEPISALDEVRRRMHDLQLPGRRIRRLQIECAVWPVAVVVAGEDAEHPLEISARLQLDPLGLQLTPGPHDHRGARPRRVPGPHHPHPLDRRQHRRTRRFPHRATQPNRRRRAESHPAALSRPQRGHDTTIADALSTSCHYSGSRSMRNVNGLVASALDADKQSPRQKLP
jgi:hypothetical protein